MSAATLRDMNRTNDGLVALSDDFLDDVHGGLIGSSEPGLLSLGSDTSNELMTTLTCNLAGSVLGDAGGIVGTMAALAIGGTVGVVLAPVLVAVTSNAFENTTRDTCLNAGGGTTDLGNISGTVVAP